MPIIWGGTRRQGYSEAVYLDVDAWGASRSGTGAAYIVKIDLEFYDSHIESVFSTGGVVSALSVGL